MITRLSYPAGGFSNVQAAIAHVRDDQAVTRARDSRDGGASSVRSAVELAVSSLKSLGENPLRAIDRGRARA
jgi:hypothetical protein